MSYRVLAVVRLFVMLATGVAAVVGYQVDADVLWQVAADVLAVCAGVWAWWKNAPITVEAVDAQRYLEALRAGAFPSVASIVAGDVVSGRISADSVVSSEISADAVSYSSVGESEGDEDE